MRWGAVLFALGVVAVLLLALRLRLPTLGGRPIGFDEAFHSTAAFEAPDVATLRRSITPQFQPLLDHLMRRFVWRPLLGQQEIGIRLPAMIASLLATLATMATVGFAFLRNGRSRLEAALGALAAGVWHAGYAQDIGAAGFARHYTLTECLSMAWAGLFLFGEPERAWRRFALCSFVLANTHFFSLALIGAGYAFLAAEHLARARRWVAAREVAVFAGIVLFTALINWPALSALLSAPIEARSLGHGGIVPTAFAETTELVVRFLDFLDLPVFPALVWLVLALAGGLVRLVQVPQSAKAATLACLAIPGLFFLGRLRSGYAYHDRYFMPFLGLAPVLLALGAVVIVVSLERALARLPAARATRLQALAGVPLGAYLVVAAPALARQPGSLAAPALPSARADFMEALKREPHPVFLLASPCWTEAAVRIYWKDIGAPAATELRVASPPGSDECAVGGFDPGSRADAELREFLARSPGGTVALYQHHLGCFRARFPPPVTITRSGTSGSCLTVLRGVTSVEQARAAAVAVAYPARIEALVKQR